METVLHSEINHQDELEVLFQDEHMIMINKPSGVLVHKSELDYHEDQNILSMLKKQLQKWLYPVHRLDKATSGVLLFAFDQETAQMLCNLFANHGVKKEYLAVVRGYAKAQGIIDSPLKDLLRAGKTQDAMTHYELLETYEHPFPVRPYATSRYSLVRLRPQTGRRHQIRRHLKHIFHPIVGDTCYGDGKHNLHCRQNFSCGRLMLHASLLSFVHPHSGKALTIEALPPKSFSSIVTALRAWPGT